RKGISKGRSDVVLTYADGVLFVAENTSSTLRKVSEIYDRIGFAAVGRYSEFEALRVAGVRHADLRGYQYDRRDVNARSLADALRFAVAAFDAAGPSSNGDRSLEVAVLDRNRPRRAFRRIQGAALEQLLASTKPAPAAEESAEEPEKPAE